MAIKPMVDGLKEEIGVEGRVIRINVKDKGPLVKALDLKMTPTFVFLDPSGQELFRTIGKFPDRNRILTYVKGW